MTKRDRERDRQNEITGTPRPRGFEGRHFYVWDEDPRSARRQARVLSRVSGDPARPVGGPARVGPILVPVAFGEAMEAVLRHADRLARRDAAQLELLHVCDERGDDSIAESRAAEARLRELARAVSAEARVHVFCGQPDAVILEAAERLAPRTIVMGAHRRSPSRRVGQLAARVRDRADCAVRLVTEQAC